MATGLETVPKMENDSEMIGYFPYDEETTDMVIRVDDKRLNLSRGTLMQASPVFRKMLSSNGNEKQKSRFLRSPMKRSFSFSDVSVRGNLSSLMVRIVI